MFIVARVALDRLWVPQPETEKLYGGRYSDARACLEACKDLTSIGNNLPICFFEDPAGRQGYVVTEPKQDVGFALADSSLYFMFVKEV
jgi:hypothetical protein